MGERRWFDRLDLEFDFDFDDIDLEEDIVDIPNDEGWDDVDIMLEVGDEGSLLFEFFPLPLLFCLCLIIGDDIGESISIRSW